MNFPENLKIKLFADGAELTHILSMNSNPLIHGLTTNPSLMKKAGITRYRDFAKEILAHVQEKPISFEVISDDLIEMKQQALEIASWGKNVYVKIPITTTQKQFTGALIHELSHQGVQLNITALMTVQQVISVTQHLSPQTPSYLSIFAGRIADTGVDPTPIMAQALLCLNSHPYAELIWASCREVLNIFQADHIGCPIITVPHDILGKLSLVGYDLEEYSLDTVKMFYQDALNARIQL